MPYEILCIVQPDLPLDELANTLVGEEGAEYNLRRVGSMAEAEPSFYETRVGLVIADGRIEGVFESLSAMKHDEMFRHLPIIGIVPDGDADQIREALSFGLDNVVSMRSAESLLSPLAKPLLRTFRDDEEMLGRISELQERAIQDFILVDLIKDYIPKTIWDIARSYAHLQKISIPEEETELTIVFGDIKGFSAMTQHMPPRDVIRTLNTVFDVATRIVYEYGGDIDKFIGDGFFAIYQDPKAAVDSMVQLQRDLEDVNRRRVIDGLPTIEFRIGIHTGPIIRGNVGGNHRYDNTLIGDSVNTANRLETIAPPGGILISEATMKKARLSIPGTYRRRERLRGRDVEETFYEVYDYLK